MSQRAPRASRRSTALAALCYLALTLPGKAGNYEDTLVPHAVFSPYITYTSDAQDWGGGFWRHVCFPDPADGARSFDFPSYVTMNVVLGFVRLGWWDATLNIDNIADARYFTRCRHLCANLGALPGLGRTWRITLKRVF